MKPTRALFVSFKSQALFFAVLLASISVYAQDRSTSILADPRMVVIPARSPDEIATDIDNAAAGKQIALNRKAQADNRLKEIENSIRDREMSRKDIEARMNDAKKGKRESELISLQIESKASQQAIDLLKRLKDLRRAEIEEAEVEAEHAESEIRALQLENELQDKRTEYNSQATNGAGDLALTTARQVLSELEVRLLKLQQEQAGATQKLASKQRDVINQRMKLHQAKLKLGIPRK
jgi:hypothetical protein